ncbi:uncharacterized protein LOC110851340 [Folsomia candida]|uniref:Uncharacterized protein n=1 Tax=Folsomia candida TaxID=158441 RepID=A0A226E6W6_FOLCA|nr:uncharacterized protein LOC110851340 [Folsomia candida]OXA53199.1 hypothetical protein Fcan01_12592 [Folsomia candida]
MEEEGHSSGEDFVVRRPPVAPMMEGEEEVAGPSSNKRSKRQSSPTHQTPSVKLLPVEKKKHPLAPTGYLNPPGTKDTEKRKSVTSTSSAREDDDFEPIPWYYFPEEEGEIQDEGSGGIYIRTGELAEEFEVRYSGGASESRIGKIKTEEGVDLIRKTILQLVGKDSPSAPELDIEESSPELIFTQKEEGLTDDERELLFTKIFEAGGRVPVVDKPDWNLIIHKAPTTGIIHLCIESMRRQAGGDSEYRAYRLCTKENCYQYQRTTASAVLPKCLSHKETLINTVMGVTPYEERNTLVRIHVKFLNSVRLNSSDSETKHETKLHMSKTISTYQTWKDYCATKEVHPIPKEISMHHYDNEQDALKRLALESTIGMMMKLAPGTMPFINLDAVIPFSYGMEDEIDTRLKELGMHLKILRKLKPEENVAYPFPGQYLLGTPAADTQKPEKGTAFLYTITSREMWYFGWSDTPDFKIRLDGRRTDGASEYKRITEARTYPPGINAPTLTCSLLAKCADKDKETIEAKMIISGYIAYLLGLRNPLRPQNRSARCYSTNKCVLLSLIGPGAWSEICQFIKLFWRVEPMLGKFEKQLRSKNRVKMDEAEEQSDGEDESSEDEDYNPAKDMHNQNESSESDVGLFTDAESVASGSNGSGSDSY